jgi:hypothetical protein
MAQPKWLDKYLTMKPDVSKIFDDLEAWHDHCRFEMIDFNQADLYKSKAYRDFTYRKNGGKGYRGNGERKPYLGKNPRPYNNDRFSN